MAPRSGPGGRERGGKSLEIHLLFEKLSADEFSFAKVGCMKFFKKKSRWDAKRLEREAAAKAKEQQKPPVPPTKVGHT